MRTVGLGGIGNDPLVSRAFNLGNFQGNSRTESPVTKPVHPFTTPPAGPGGNHSHTQALRALTFGKGPLLDELPGVELQSKLLNELETVKDPEEKAMIAEMLGRGQVIRAIPALLKLLDDKEPVAVRSAAITALGIIGNATHPNSFTRTTLNQELLKVYEGTKVKLKAQVGMKQSTNTLKSLLSANEDRQDQVEALKNIAVSLGKLNVETGRTIILQEYKKSLEVCERNHQACDEIRRAIDLAKEDFIRSLEQQFQKPIDEITGSLSPSELRSLTGNIVVQLPGGKQIGVRQAEDVLRALEVEQKYSASIMLGLVEGMAQHNDSQVNNILKLGLSSHLPNVKSRSLLLLGERNELNYTSDIHPNLSSPHKEVRQAALKALMQSNDAAAKQTLMDFLKPARYFATIGESPSPQSMRHFVNFLTHLSENGDNYALPLIKVAANADFDLERRSLAMLVLQSMTQKPFRKNISNNTVAQAYMLIHNMATRPTGKNREERDEIALFATTLWVGMKDPDAISAAVKLADDRFRGLTPKDQENLLEAVFMALQDDYHRARQDSPDEDGLARAVVNVMRKSVDPAFLSKEAIEQLEIGLGPSQAERLTRTSLEEIAKKSTPEVQETEFVLAARDQTPALAPILARLLKHEKSTVIRMISARILGLLKAQDSVDQLIEQTRNPLKGLMDWSKDPSFKGNPTYEGANMRLNNLIALGQIGDARAAGVMLDAMDDPALKRHVLAPLGQLAPSVNAENKAETLAAVQGKLMGIVDVPSTTRLQRAIRMAAADALYQFNGGVDRIKRYLDDQKNPEFKRHVASALLKNGHGLKPDHPDHSYVKPLLTQGMGVEKIHATGTTGRGIEIGIVDGGYVDQGNSEAFQDRIRLPAKAGRVEHPHPTMVMTTAGGNGVIKGVAPDVVAYSEMWPDFDSKDPMGVFKKMIEGKIRGENNIRVINNSWGFSDNNILIYKDVRNILKEFKKVVNLAEKAGILFVFAAGNEGEEAGIPGIGTLSLFGLDVDKLTGEEKADLSYIMDKVVLVGAANPLGSDDPKQHRLADFSSVGDSLNRKLLPTVLAPGVDMSVYGYENGKRTRELVNGTSFAAPFVTGLTALMWQKNPKLTPAQVRDILKATAVPLPGLPDTYQGVGEVSPQEALRQAEALRPRKRKKPQLVPPAQPQAAEPQGPPPPPPIAPDSPVTPPAAGDKPPLDQAS
jgi:HEAT repeat protein